MPKTTEDPWRRLIEDRLAALEAKLKPRKASREQKPRKISGQVTVRNRRPNRKHIRPMTKIRVPLAHWRDAGFKTHYRFLITLIEEPRRRLEIKRAPNGSKDGTVITGMTTVSVTFQTGRIATELEADDPQCVAVDGLITIYLPFTSSPARSS